MIDFVVKGRDCDTADAIRFIEERLGIVHKLMKRETRLPAKWPELRRGTMAELARLNAMRGFAVDALSVTEQRGFLCFGVQWSCGFWAVTDSRRALIELRRITGEPWRAFGRLPERKAHCIGSGKDWPVGVVESERFVKLAFVEGAPDFVAAIQMARIEGKEESVAPVGMLGAGVGRIAAEALSFFRGKHVRFYPHLDEAGRRAVKMWARQIADAGAAKVEAFDFSGLIREDGRPGKDLADVCRIRPDCFEAQRKFWGVMP